MDYNGSVMKRVALFLIVAGAAVAMVACQGAVGKTGEPGEPGAQGPPGEADNKAPFANIPFKTVMLMDGGKVETVDAADHFHDPEKEALSFRATVTMGEGIVTVTQKGSVFTITPQAAGNAEITVTATDPKGKSGFAKINVMVTSEKIMYDGSLPRRIALVPGGVRIISGAAIEGAFEEDEGETPEISVSSSDDTIVTAVKGDDNSVTITALDPADREATVTITATDDDGDTAEAMITVAVVESLAPQRSDTTPDPVTLTVGGPATDVNASDYFSDPSGGDLTYTVESSNNDTATAVEADGVVTITAVAAGGADVTITATNSYGDVSQKIMVTVNAAPVVVPAVTWKKEIPDVTFEHDGTPKMFMLADYFNDATMYDTDHGDGTVVTAEVNDEQTMLTLTRVGPGTATVEVTPSNSVGDGIAQSITVTVNSPAAQPDPPTLKPGKNIPPAVRIIALTAETANGFTDDPITGADLIALNSAEKVYMLRDLIKDPERADLDLEFSTTTTDATIVAVYGDPDDEDSPSNNNSDERAATTKATLDKMTPLTESNIRLRGRKPGTAMVMITASSDSGQSETWTIEVTVASTNMGPIVGAGDDGTTTVVFPGTAADTNVYNKFVGLNGANRLKLNPTKVWKEKLDLGSLFYDPDVEVNARSTGDSWTFKAGSTDEKVVTVGLDSTNNSEKPDEYYVTLTPVDSGEAIIYFTVTDSFGQSAPSDTPTAATDAMPDFSVRVNSAPKAEGNQAAPATAETLARLSERYNNLGLTTGFSTVTNADGTDNASAHQVTMAVDGGGYFSDEDSGESATLMCRFDLSGDDIFMDTGDPLVDYPRWSDSNVRRVLQLHQSEAIAFKQQGTAHIEIWCEDTFGDVSERATLTIKVTSQGSIH